MVQTHTVMMKIDTGSHVPIKLKSYSTPLHKRPLVKESVRDMLEPVIVESSESPLSFPIVVVGKKNGRHRFCLDFWRLNVISNPLAVALSLIYGISALLGKAIYFSTIDLRLSSMWQTGRKPHLHVMGYFSSR